jgi:hypothetical protein
MTLGEFKTKLFEFTGTTVANYPLANMTIDLNVAIDKIHADILESQDGFRMDDPNNAETDEFSGIAYADLVAGQDNYSFPTSLLKIHQIEVNYAGQWIEVTPMGAGETNYGIDDYPFSTANPRYEALGDHIILYPAPPTSVTAGLKIVCDRNITPFTEDEVTAGTKTLPFDRNFHIMIPLECAVMWKTAKGLDAGGYINQLNGFYPRLRQHYGSKQKDKKHEFIPYIENYL